MKKRIIAIILLLILAAGAGIAGICIYREKTEKIDAAEERLWLEWDKYLQFRNEIDSIHLWMLDYLNTYVEDRSWEQLLKARAATTAGREALNRIELPDISIGKEIKDVLTKQKDEVESIILISHSVVDDLEQAILFAEQMKYTLENFFLYQPEHQQMKLYVALSENQIRLEERETAAFTNHLLLTWNMHNRWEEMLANYPSFAAFCDPWEQNSQLLQERVDMLADEAYDLFVESENNLMLGEMMLEALKNAEETGNYDELRKMISIPSGLPVSQDGNPAFFPLPHWAQEPSSIYYGIPVNDEEIKLVEVGMDITEVPTTAYYFYDYVSYSEYSDYFERLKEIGFYGKMKDDDKGNSTMIVTDGTHNLVVQWSTGETILRVGNPMACLISLVDLYILMKT